MGNIRGFGGPLSRNWHNRTVHLQHKILRRMRELGIVPVLPAFAGHVPRAFSRLFPNANMTKIDPWNKFEDEYCWYDRNLSVSRLPDAPVKSNDHIYIGVIVTFLSVLTW